jgi:nucleoside-diphosphate-sugar epimerase
MISSRDLVLVTGATGFIGSHTLLHLLRAGHRVRAAVRSEAKIASVLARPQIQALNPGSRLEFAIVPDITTLSAYDDAAEGVTHIVHIASPLASGANAVPPSQHEARFITPAVRGTLNMLEAADRAGTVRRVVITSSFVALVPLAELEGSQIRDAGRPVTPNDRIPFPAGPYKSEFAAYAASKVAALQHAEEWIAQQRPAFDVVHLHPGFVLGRNDGATTVPQAMKGTNSVVLALLQGRRFGPFAGATVHVDDVARAHVAALSPRVFGDQSYILSGPVRWDDAIGIAKREFRDAFKKRVLIKDGSVGTTELPMDTTLTELTFRFEFAGYEEQVKSIVEQFLELRSRNRGVVLGGSAAAKREVTAHLGTVS